VITALATATLAAPCGEPPREYGKSEPAPRPAVHRVAASSGHAPSAGAWGSSTSDLRRASLAAAGDIACPRRPCLSQRRTARLVRRLDPRAVLTLGDNQYDSGSLRDFRRSYRPTWGAFREKTHPAPGNHDYETTGARGYFRFFGAAAHGPRGFYAFRVGRWRLFALNTENRGRHQTRWLRRVVRRDDHRCELAYWHEPRWSSGTNHGGSSAVAAWWRILYRRGVDVVLNGHEHNYERFAKLTPRGRRSQRGIRQFVVGTGGNGLYPFGPAQRGSERRLRSYGVLSMRLEARSYRWRFHTVGGRIADSGHDRCHL
jgi:hypothetical protein